MWATSFQYAHSKFGTNFVSSRRQQNVLLFQVCKTSCHASVQSMCGWGPHNGSAEFTKVKVQNLHVFLVHGTQPTCKARSRWNNSIKIAKTLGNGNRPVLSCFMTMIDYYLLGPRVSFCVCKNSCHVVHKLPCCLSGSSLSSDIATQVTCIVFAQCSSKFSSSDVVTCFLLSGGLVFLFVFTTPYRGFIACGRSNVRSGARTFEPDEGWWRKEVQSS